MATTACLDGSNQDIDETTNAQAAVTNHEVRVRRILGTILDEGGDEIDFQLTSSGVPRTVTTPTGQQIGTDDGRFVVRFTGGVRYDVWFQVL